MHSRRSTSLHFGSVVFVALLVLSVGAKAAAIELYDAGRDKAASAAKDAWHAVDMNAVVSAEQANLKALLAAELATQDELAASIRDHRLRGLIGAPLQGEGGLLTLIDSQYLELVNGDNFDAVAGARNAIDAWKASKVKFYQVTLHPIGMNYKIYKLGDLSCSDVKGEGVPAAYEAALKKADDAGKGVITQTLEDMRQACKSQPSEFPLASAFPDGALRRALEQVEADAGALEKAQAELEGPRKAYEKAVKEYTDAVAASKKPMDGVTAKALDAKRTEAVDALKKISDLQSALGVQFVAKERLASLNDFITTVNQGVDAGSVPDGASKAAAGLILFENLAKDAQKSLDEKRAPLNVPLQLYRDQQKLTLDAVTVDVNGWKAQVDFDKQIVEVLLAEMEQLAVAHRAVTLQSNTPALKANLMRFKDTRFDTVMSRASPDEKEVLITGAAYYLDAVNRLDAQRYKLEYMRIAARYDRSVAYSAVNLKRWQSLIDVSVDQVADYYAGGIKPETISSILSSVGLLATGYGVNNK